MAPRQHGTSLGRTFEAVVFDWDGTAVPHRQAPANAVRTLVEQLTAAGADVAVVSGGDVGDIDGQLGARPNGPGRLLLGLSGGSELIEVGLDGPRLVRRRTVTVAQGAALDQAALLTVAALAERGLVTEVVSARLNRRRIDLVPEPAWANPPKARIAELLDAVLDRLRAAGIANLASAAALAAAAAADAGLEHPRVTCDIKHLEIGLTDTSDSMRDILDTFSHRGVGPGLVLVLGDEFGGMAGLPGSDARLLLPDVPRLTAVSVGVEPEGVPPSVLHLGGGPRMFRGLLAEQLRRRRLLRVPEVDEDPAWVIVEEVGDGTRQRVADALFTLSDGELATRGAREDTAAETGALVLADGVYTGQGSGQQLLPGPWWPAMRLPSGSVTDRRTLDLRSGLLLRERRWPAGVGADRPPVRTLRFASAGTAHVLAIRAEGPARLVGPAPPAPPASGRGTSGRRGDLSWSRATGDDGGGIAVLALDRCSRDAHVSTVERLATFATDARRPPGQWSREALLRQSAARGFESLLSDHRAAWAGRWRDVNVLVPDDPQMQLAARFALFHLWGVAARDREAAVGARGLTGPGYRGHVFWDADVFALPALVTMSPSAARAMLTYRLRRLPQARAAARARGCAGARFPWESARDGDDVTPRSTTLNGVTVPIRTGDLEEHIVADVAWAADRYAAWTGDAAWLAEVGHPLIVETARYWACRCRTDDEGRAHIDGVIGPDEYHEDVDDNAFTNVMARWNLRRGADLLDGLEPGSTEPGAWRDLSDRIVDGYDPATGVYEQFAGYLGLEPLTAAALGRTPVAADLVLPPDRLHGSQILKQADVLMLHHLVPDEVEPGSLTPNLDFYQPRTAHGSSLSPAITAAVLARAGRGEEALDLLRVALRIDLDDLTGATPSGLHVASMAGAWQAIVHGFAGLRVRDGALEVDPRLPTDWHRLGLCLRCLGRRVRVDVLDDHATLRTDGPIPVWSGHAIRTVHGEALLEPSDGGWQIGQVM